MKGLMLSVLCCIMIIGLTCKPTTLYFGKPSVYGQVYRYNPYGSNLRKTGCDVEVMNTRLLPIVCINNDTLNLEYFEQMGEYMWSSEWYHDNLNLNPGDRCELKIYQSNGDANAVEYLPGDISFTSPQAGSVIHQGSNLSFTWTKSNGADRCIFHLSVEYEYGYWNYFYLDTTITILDTNQTSLTIPKEIIFPSYVDTVHWGNGYAQILAESGPLLGKVKNGNVSGNGVGYFLAHNASRELEFYIEEMRMEKTPKLQTEPLHKRIFKERVNYLKNQIATE